MHHNLVNICSEAIPIAVSNFADIGTSDAPEQFGGHGFNLTTGKVFAPVASTFLELLHRLRVHRKSLCKLLEVVEFDQRCAPELQSLDPILARQCAAQFMFQGQDGVEELLRRRE